MFTNMQRHNVTSSYFYSINCRIVKLVTAIGCVHITESVGSRRELVANSCTHRRRRRDATKQFRRVGVGGVYWALDTYPTRPLCWWAWHLRRTAQRRGRRQTMDYLQYNCGQGCANSHPSLHCIWSYHRRCHDLPDTDRTQGPCTYYSGTRDDWVPRWRPIVHLLHTSRCQS